MLPLFPLGTASAWRPPEDPAEAAGAEEAGEDQAATSLPVFAALSSPHVCRRVAGEAVAWKCPQAQAGLSAQSRLSLTRQPARHRSSRTVLPPVPASSGPAGSPD